MCYIRIILIAAIAVAAFSQLRAELPAPLIEVKDTLCRMNNNQGNAKGAVFMPDGKTIIGIMDDTPIVIDAVTGQEIRRLDSIPKKSVGVPMISNEGKYLFAICDLGLAVWNIQTGKILKYLRFCADYCLSPDGTKLYETISNDKNNTGVIRVYDLNTLEEIEIFCGHDFLGGGEIAISPDGQTLAVCVSHDPIGYEGDNINRSVILIDLNKKIEFTKIESMTPWITDMQFSPDGNNLIYLHKNGDKYINIYHKLTKEIKKITENELELIIGYKSLLSGYPNFLDDNTISFIFSKYLFIYKYNENTTNKLINFLARTIDIHNNSILLSDIHGNLVLLDLLEVSVKDKTEPENSFIQYSNNLFEYYSNRNYIGESIIYDTTGKQILSLGSQSFLVGKNIIQVNQPLAIGIYILTIKSDIEHISKKFIVE